MGRIVVSTAISVDGCTEGDVAAMPLDHSFNEHSAEPIGRTGSLLYGATTYRGMMGYRPLSRARSRTVRPRVCGSRRGTRWSSAAWTLRTDLLAHGLVDELHL